MKDGFNREIEYVRVSVTPHCNLKCIYCAPNQQQQKLSEAPVVLTTEEMVSILRAMVNLGIRKVRITGGEPLVRNDICEMIEQVAQLPGIEDLSLTTNGINLEAMAEGLKKAGLKRLNISLDSLRPERFSYITGGGDLDKVLNGIEKALQLGLTPLKINTVLVKGINDDEINDLIDLAKDRPVEVRMIELMPIGSFGEQNTGKIVYNSDIIKERPHLIPWEGAITGQPAEYFQIEGYQGKIGFISPLSHQFCDRCNRVRLTCDGKIRLCLGHNDEVDVMQVLRENPQDLENFIAKSIAQKPKGHHFREGFSSSRKMNLIGG